MNHPLNRRAAALALSGALITALGACSADDEPEAAPPPIDPAETTSRTADCPAISGSFIELDPGCWAFGRPGLQIAAQVTLPAGFTGNPGAVWVNSLGDDDWGHLGITTTGDVHSDPCTRTAAPPSNSATINDFAEALAAQKVTTTTEPVPVSLGGHEGLQLTVSAPAEFDASRCTDEALVAWQEKGDGLAGIGPGDVVRLWVVDVDGQQVVLVLNTEGDGTEETVELLTSIAESATFAKS